MIAVDRKACSVIFIGLFLLLKDLFAPLLAHDFEEQYVVEAGDNVSEEEQELKAQEQGPIRLDIGTLLAGLTEPGADGSEDANEPERNLQHREAVVR